MGIANICPPLRRLLPPVDEETVFCNAFVAELAAEPTELAAELATEPTELAAFFIAVVAPVNQLEKVLGAAGVGVEG